MSTPPRNKRNILEMDMEITELRRERKKLKAEVASLKAEVRGLKDAFICGRRLYKANRPHEMFAVWEAALSATERAKD